MSSPVLRLSGVKLELDGKVALRRVDWRVHPGESWAVIGPNGAGKTSLLSIINGYRWPTEGEVSVMGRRFGESDLRDLRLEVGIVSSYLTNWIPQDEKVIDFVVSGKFGATRLFGRSEPADRKYAISLLRVMDCSRYVGRRIEELSQGERQKVAIARSLMPRPKLLTLDEPCEGLDLRAREKFLRGLSRLARGGVVTMIDVTHRTDEIPADFTHALLMKEGEVLESGPIEATLTSRNLSECFDVRVKLRRWRGRYYSLAAG